MTARLTEAHRVTQQRLGAHVNRLLVAVFALLDPDDLDGSFDEWVAQVESVVQSGRTASARLAASYLEAIRERHLGESFAPVVADVVDPQALRTSMLVTGPISIRANLGRMMPLDRAVSIARDYTAGAGMRHALNGGRETITSTIQADRRAVGYQRVTGGNSCDFCSMLAERGAVYGAESASFEAHDRCSCSAEPVYA